MTDKNVEKRHAEMDWQKTISFPNNDSEVSQQFICNQKEQNY